MGNNVIESTLIDRITDLGKSLDLTNLIQEEGEQNVSSWQNRESSIENERFLSENPYKGRKIGITKNKQDKKTWWKNISCPSCDLGFNTKSSVKKCHACEKIVHRKPSCIVMCENETYFFINFMLRQTKKA